MPATPVPTAGYDWTFDPDRSDGGVTVDRINADMPEYRVGASIRLECQFWRNVDDTTAVQYDTGGTAGGAAGFTVGGAVGATVGPIQDPSFHLTRYERVREYTRWAGTYALNRALNGKPRITERLPPDASVDSIIVELVPGPSLDVTDGLWVVLDDVDDSTRIPEDMATIEITATILARGDQYADRAALKNDLGASL